jgi:1-acyl-sn-glycerol-3-phosphate acyltransferase
MWLKALSRVFYRHDLKFIGDVPPDPWSNLKLVVFLNHTSLFEPVFLGGPVPASFVWRVARHGVVPAADKTINRPIVGALFRFVAHQVVSISRERDHTWHRVLRNIDPDSMVIILPEGRMMRANGLDSSGNPMTVRGGIADILDSIPDGRMLIAYSGGLHHVQIPGHAPRVFKRVRLRLEVLDIAGYREGLMNNSDREHFKRAVIRDLERRRDQHCPLERETPA